MSDEAVRNLIYPPVLDTYQASNVITQPMKITYTMPEYNLQNLTRIKEGYIHVSLTNQSNNLTAFYNKASVKIIPFSTTEYDEDNRIGVITIWPSDVTGLQEEGVTPFNNSLYKIQLRFDFTQIVSEEEEGPSSSEWWVPSTQEAVTAYLNTNADNFSEWSKVSLIKPISTPSVYLNEKTTQTIEGKLSFTVPKAIKYVLEGYLSFEDKGETDSLNSYYFEIGDGQYISEIYYPSKTNWIEGTFDLDSLAGSFTEEVSLSLKIYYTTKNGYDGLDDRYVLQIMEYQDGAATLLSVDVEIDEDLGTNLLILNYGNVDETRRVDVFRKTLGYDDTEWQKIADQPIYDGEMYVGDFSIESGIFYNYAIQEKTVGKDGKITATWTPIYKPTLVCNNFYDATLIGQNRLLHIGFDFTVSQYTKKAGRVMTETLGGQYPHFTKNGRLNYRQLGISAKISIEDFGTTFASYDELLGGGTYDALESSESHYEDIERKDPRGGYQHPGIPKTAEVMVERKYREMVYDWLNNSKPKLFRSGPEGNMIVMLDNVSMTPESTIGRLIYNFSATMYEIADANDYNKLVLYGIVTPEE